MGINARLRLLQIKQYLLVLCRSGEIGNGVRAFG